MPRRCFANTGAESLPLPARAFLPPKPILVLLLVLLVLAAVPAAAVKCSITVTPLNFGVYDILSGIPVDATAQVNISCNNIVRNPLPVTFQLSAGGSGNVAQRTMASTTGGPDLLLYNLYANAGMSTVLGDGSGGSTSLVQTLDKTTPWTVTLYGRIVPLQNVRPDTYGDSLIATILW